MKAGIQGCGWRFRPTVKALFALSGGRAFLHPARRRWCDWPTKKMPRAVRKAMLRRNGTRDDEIVRRARAGFLYREIASAFGIKVQRVQQIISQTHPEKGWKVRVNQERRTA